MTAPRFDLVDLSLFVAVGDASSITRGADRMNLAVASASERIQKLEQALGVALLRRVRRGVELTAAGTALLDHARLVLRNVQVMQGEATNFARGIKASVRLLANTAATVEHLPGALASFLAADTDVTIELEERESADIAQALVAGAAELGIAIEDALPDSLARIPFCDDRLVLVVPADSELAADREVAFGRVAHLPFIGLPQPSALQGHIGRQAAALGVRLNIRARLTDVAAICRLVEAGAGIAVLPAASALRCRDMGIRTLHLTDAWALRQLAICARDFDLLPAPARRLVEHLRRHGRPVLPT